MKPTIPTSDSPSLIRSLIVMLGIIVVAPTTAGAQGTRLLRQPDISERHIVFAYGGDIWIVAREGGTAQRITSTPAVESDPDISPDGQTIAFTSNRSGSNAIYSVPVAGGTPTRLSWHRADSHIRGWTPDGTRILYASTRETAPTSYNRLWTVAATGGPPDLIPAPWGNDGSYSADGRRMVVDRMDRWDGEWRHYRGGQNTPLTILDLRTLAEIRLPNERSTDVQPVWLEGIVYFLSDRNFIMNVWAYDPATTELRQVSHFADADVKWLAGYGGTLVVEQNGWIHTVDPTTGLATRLEITVRGDFPWAETRWEDVSDMASAASLSPTGQRALFEARGEIFTVPAEDGDTRNITRTTGAADRTPIWSPDGASIAWFSNAGDGYRLLVADQNGMEVPREISIGESKMAWDPAWSPDGERIAFVDDDVRVRVVEVGSGTIRTIDVGGVNIERGSLEPRWSPDSRWLAYSKTFANNFRRIVVWSVDTGEATPVTDMMADAVEPAWDRDGRHLYFLASTDLALASGWANTSAMQADPRYAAYVMVLRGDDPTPFPLESDEEVADTDDGTGAGAPEEDDDEAEDEEVRIDFAGIERRVIPLPMPVRDYALTLAGPEGTVFIGERPAGQSSLTIHKFALAEAKAEEFVSGISQAAVSRDGTRMLIRSGGSWRIVDTGSSPSGSNGNINVNLRMQLDRRAEWAQMFEEAWRYERDYFYDPNMHGNDWDDVHDRYAPLVPFIRHRADLTYVLDQVNGELSVGHSFVFGGDMPDVDAASGGLLGADLVRDDRGWRIGRIYTFESWNPNLSAPLDRPGLEVAAGDYIVAVNGVPLTVADDPYRLLDGTAGRQTVLHLNDQPTMDDARSVTVEPISSENQLRQRAWVEDNRRRVDELSGGRLGYVWIPNTGGAGVVSFDRYYFAQQDREGAVIDERFNGGGSLDDYMVDLMTRQLRAAITNEVPRGRPFRLPAGILGPKVLLINELAGSGGDFFPWVFRQQNAGPLIGKRTWGGLVKSSVHYALSDGGALTAPDNAVFDPINNRWIAENEGIPPDIEVELDAVSVAAGRDPQLERAVQEALRLLGDSAGRDIRHPAYSRPARRP